MPGLRLILIALFVWLAFLTIKNFVRRAQITTTNKKKAPDISKIVQCANCGVHVPEKEAIKRGEKYYCCEMHAKTND